MSKELKRLKELSQCKHLVKADRDAIVWAMATLGDKPEEAREVAEVDQSQVVLWLPLNSGEHPVTGDDIKQAMGLYPSIDVVQEFRAMYAWLDANKTKRKTKTGIKRFINSWLARAHDKGGSKLTLAVKPQAKLSPSERFRQRVQAQGRAVNF